MAVQSAPVGAPVAAAPRFTHVEIALAVLAFGILARLVWLAIGFFRLQRYRRHSTPLTVDGWSAPLSWGVEADLRISDDIPSPVTFGLFKARSPAARHLSRVACVRAGGHSGA